MQYCTPEQAGISSYDVLAFYRKLEKRGLSTHSVLIAKGNRIFTECYFAPFHKDFKHRMYSVSKSFVAIAVGFCEQDGLLSLDDPLTKYFGDYIKPGMSDKVISVTIREMLRMETGKNIGYSWFETVKDDRCSTYFDVKQEKYPNTLFDYDSPGSFMLGAIVEKLTGKPFLNYLIEKVLGDIGFSKDAYCLKAPGGYSWSDSGIMCTAMDMLLFARFVLNGGSWNGKQYLNKQYVKEATTMSVSNNDYGFETPQGHGYGYQIWGEPDGAFGFHGMGGQYAVCHPKKDIVFVITSDNQGHPFNYTPIQHALFDHIIDRIGDSPLPDNDTAYRELTDYTSSRKLFVLPGDTHSDFSDKIAGKTYTAEPNKMGIKYFKLEFENEGGVFRYENEQGVKELRFGFGYNEFQKFPQEGYSDMIGTVSVPGHRYDCAVSADWPEKRKLRLRVQIIDKYFGNLAIVFGFRDENHVSVRMVKSAEAFLNEYEGIMNASAE